MTSAEFFKENKYLKIENLIPKDVATISYNYIKLSALRCENIESNYLIDKRKIDSDIWGEFNDPQAPGDYSRYGDLFFDTMLVTVMQKIENCLDKKLEPTYSYNRLYTTDTELVKHRDRPSCEISATLCIGSDISNLDDQSYNWPMFISKQEEDTGEPVYLNPGDCIIYSGCDLYHWREPFKGKNHAQVFLHYNEIDGKFKGNKFDGREVLGLPAEGMKKYYENQ